MKFKKIAAIAAASAVALSMSAVSVFAEDTCQATLGFTDVNWTYQDWESAVEITGDGTYTITSTAVAGTEEIGVFVIDCQGMFASHPDAVATLDKLEIDGNEISFDADKIMYGDIENKGNYRIDIYNMYSDTKDNPGINNATPITESLSVTFTVSGFGAAAAAEEEVVEEEVVEEVAEEAAPVEEAAPAADTTTTPAATGNHSAASVAVVMAVAAAAALAVKKSK